MRRFLAICLLLLGLSSCSALTPCTDDSCTRVLFIGNSYTYVNDLPATFAKLADAGGHQVETGMAAQGGWALMDHATSSDTLSQLNSTDWDYVILQEQSQIPSVGDSRTQLMYPAARTLVQKIRGAGAVPVFFVTWAHRGGYPEKGMDYEIMQAQINMGYSAIAQELGVAAAPVGNAWFSADRADPAFELWQEDGSHPSSQGTYLAASVFYVMIFGENPEGLTYHPAITDESALLLQRIAFQTVMQGQ